MCLFIWYNHVPVRFCEIDPSDLLNSALLIRSVFVIAWCWFRIATGGFLECSMGFLHLQRRGEAIDREQQWTAFCLYLTNRLFKTLELSLLHHFLCNQLRKVQGVLFTVSFYVFLSYHCTSERVDMRYSEERTRSTFCSFHCEELRVFVPHFLWLLHEGLCACWLLARALFPTRKPL